MLARVVYHAPLAVKVWWRRLIGPIPKRRSDGYYSFIPRWPVLWRSRGFTVSQSFLTDEESGILLANQGAPVPKLMPPVMRTAWALQWEAIVAEQHRKGAREFAEYLAEYERREEVADGH